MDYKLKSGREVGIRQDKTGGWRVVYLDNERTMTNGAVPYQKGKDAKRRAERLLDKAVKEGKGVFNGASPLGK